MCQRHILHRMDEEGPHETVISAEALSGAGAGAAEGASGAAGAGAAAGGAPEAVRPSFPALTAQQLSVRCLRRWQLLGT